MFDLLVTNTFARLAFLALVFTATILLVVWVGRFSSRRIDVRASIRQISRGPQRAKAMSLQERRTSAWTGLADKIERAGLNLTDTKDDKLREKLIAAGYPSPAAPRMFTLIRLVLVFALPLGYLILARASGKELTFFTLYVYGLGLAAAGLYLPNLVVTAKADRRRDAITNGFPDCLDLMLVCVEAGLGLEAAMDRVGREMVSSHPLVATLLSTATLQMRAGARRDEALRRMGEISGVQEVKSFSTLLIQSDKLGTSVADTLRVYAAEMREKRRLRAEEKAYRLPVLISIPLVVCMLPTMIGVLMLPGMVRIMREIMPALGG